VCKAFRYYSDLLNIVSGNSKLVLYASRKTCEKEQGTYRCTIFVKKRGKQIRYRSVKQDWTTTKCEYNECYLIIIKIKVLLLQAYAILADYGYPVLALWYYCSRPNNLSLVCLYLSLYNISPFYYFAFFFFFFLTHRNAQIIKRNYIMTNIDTQETDYSVYYCS
jgi:hypothetical protein